MVAKIQMKKSRVGRITTKTPAQLKSEKKAKKRQLAKDGNSDLTGANSTSKKPKFEFHTEITPEVRDTFYELADLRADVREEALLKLAQFEFDDIEAERYVLTRLISGASSSTRASRLSYPAGLVLRLETTKHEISLKSLFEILDAKLPFTKKDKSMLIGRLLVLSAISRSDKFKAPKEIERISKALNELSSNEFAKSALAKSAESNGAATVPSLEQGLAQLMALPKEEVKKTAVYNCLAHVFHRPQRASKLTVLREGVEDELVTAVREATGKKYSLTTSEEAEGNPKATKIRAWEVIYGIFSILKTFVTEEEFFFLEDATADALDHAKGKFHKAAAALEFALCLIRRSGSVYQNAATFLVSAFADKLTAENAAMVLGVISSVGKEAGEADDGEEEDDEFAPITPADLAKLKADLKAADEEDDDQDEEDSDDDEEEEEEEEPTAPPAPAFLAALKNALGRAGLVGNDDDDEEDDSAGSDVDLDDEEAMQIDRNLEQAFAGFSKSSKKRAKQDIAGTRLRLGQFLAFILEIAPLNAVLDFVPELVTYIAENNANQDIHPAIGAAVAGLKSYHNTAIQDSETASTKALALIKGLFTTTAFVTNNRLQKEAIAPLTGFLYRVATKEDAGQKKVIKLTRGFISTYFKEKKSTGANQVFATIVGKNPEAFIDDLETLFGYRKQLKKACKLDLLRLLTVFNRSDLITANREKYATLVNELRAEKNEPALAPDQISQKQIKKFFAALHLP